MRHFFFIVLFAASQVLLAQDWCRKADLPSTARAAAMGFSINDKGYVCGGWYGGSTNNINELWEYDPWTDSWAQKANFPGTSRRNGVTFILNGEAYVGCGWNGSNRLRDMYKYNAGTNTWSSIASYSGNGGRGSFGTSLNGKGYVGGGGSGGATGTVQRDFYEYDPILNQWTQLGNFPFGVRTQGVAESINNRVYLGLGHNRSVSFNDFWEYSPQTNTWTQLASFPGNSRFNAVSFVHDGKIIVGGGRAYGSSSCYSDYYEYNPTTNTWSLINGFTAGARAISATFTVNQRSYVSTGWDVNLDTIADTWEYDPGKIRLAVDSVLCEGDTFVYDAYRPNATYLWHDNATDSIRKFASSGIYWVDYTLSGCSYSDTIRLRFDTVVVDLGTDTTICQGENLTLDATTTNATYLWQDSSIASTYTVTQAGKYWVEVTINGCSSSDTIDVSYKPMPSVNLGADTTLCDGETLILDVTNSGATYQWQDNSTNATFSVTQADTFHVAVDLNGCIARDTIIVDYQSYPVVDFGADTALCQGESLTLDATNSGATYEWQDNSTNSTYTVTQAGKYWVDVTTNGCSSSDTIDVSYKPLPTVNLGADTTLCDGETLILDATNSGATYQWQDNSTNATFTVTQADTFYVAVDLNGCIATDTIIVDYQSYPIVELGADTALCQGESITLDATTSGATYEWQDNSTGSTFTVTQAGKYWVGVTTNGCSSSDTIDVSYKPLPTVILGVDTTLCDGETLVLDATNSGATYQWQDNSTNATYTVTQADTFYVAVDLNGCKITDSIIVDYQGDLSAVFVTDTIFCSGKELTLDATVQVPATYLWSDNSTESSLTVNDSAIYWVEISTQCDTLVDSIQVDLKNCACEFEAPNVFTPNGDGVNDYFYPKVKCQLLSYKMSIFNRWGDLVFFSNQPLLQWDGRVKSGKKAAEGYYSYIIEYRDVLSGQNNTEKGYFMLMH